MAGYLTRLWDKFAVAVLANTGDLDCRDEDYPTKVRAVVWQAVRELRKGRQIFRTEIRNEIRAERRRVARKGAR